MNAGPDLFQRLASHRRHEQNLAVLHSIRVDDVPDGHAVELILR